MKLTDANLQNRTIGAFKYSAAAIDDLGAAKYTLVTLLVDRSGSTVPFRPDMEACIGEVVKMAKYSPEADNLLIRICMFATNSQPDEVHGFKLLDKCNLDDYVGCLSAGGHFGGSTALYDASINVIQATVDYARDLRKKDFEVNSYIAVITDGCDECSKYGKKNVLEAMQDALKVETMESCMSILVGVNLQDDHAKDELEAFHKEAHFSQFIPIADAKAKTLAKLANFISRSISSQSKALGSGGPSQPMTF